MQIASDRMQMKERYDIRAESGDYKPEDVVRLYNTQRRRGLSPNLQTNWEEPYKVVSRISGVIYRIKKLLKGKLRKINFNRLTFCTGLNHSPGKLVTVITIHQHFHMWSKSNRTNYILRRNIYKEGAVR